jgi:hypothetical protein
VVERSEDPPQNAGKWWVFAALDHTLRSQRLRQVGEQIFRVLNAASEPNHIIGNPQSPPLVGRELVVAQD